MKSKFLKRLSKAVFGSEDPELSATANTLEADEAPPTESLIKAEPPPAFDKAKFLKQLMRRRPKRPYQFRRKSMTRGVQASLERAQRPGRLAFIYGSMRQGNEIAKKHREDYLRRRGARWRALSESMFPRMFEAELRRIGAM